MNSANLFAYCESNPVMGYDPTGSINWGKQWWIFLSEFGSEAFRILRRTGGGSLWDIPDMLEEADAFVKEIENLVKSLVNGSLTIKQVMSYLGNTIWDGLSGNLRYVITNYRMFGQSYVMSNQQVRDLARRTARAYEESVKIVYIIKGLVKAAKSFAAKLKTCVAKNGLGGLEFKDFRALKKHLGSPGEKREWHHIVEQCQEQKSGFSSYDINNTNNVISLDKATHTKITSYYNSIDPYVHKTLRVRDALAGKSWDYQFKFGMKTLERYGIKP